ncbi:MAG: HEAT repeat domain-containing protein [Pseudomonadota bacterium]
MAACIIGMQLLRPATARADSRTDYLIELLDESGNYRVRVQSAKTLGQIGSSAKGEEKKKIVEALMKACGDKSELVRMTAAASCGTVGDPMAMPALEKLKSDDVKEVKSQALESIKKIKAINEKLASSAAPYKPGEDPAAPPSSAEASTITDAYYIGFGSFSDKSGFQKYDALGYVKKALSSEVGNIPGVKLQPEGESKSETIKVLKKKKLELYTLTGSVGMIKFDGKNSASASVSVVVVDEGGNVRMMLKGKGTASLELSQKSAEAKEKELVLSALNTAVQGAVEPLSEQLLKSMKEGSGKDTKKKKKKKKK